uniref:Very-long-chain (3R)-3-hydroxyacyl-CoA dehydratase n=1 Tax=Elaeophora elaphi TaxID=1147741 RepID=A0A0R3RWK6_9BILA
MLTPVKLYLLLYNALQSCGWSLILWKTLRGLSQNESPQQLYQSCELELQIFQTVAVLEIIHAAASFIRSPVGTTTMQVFSRVSLVWLLLYKVASAQASTGVLLLLVAWSVTEVVRYSYYGLALINAVSSLHTWLRYSLFIVLYPLGVTGELLVILAALPEVGVKKHYTVEMPNVSNIGFSFWWYLIVYIILYIPGFPQMYMYMLQQRKKVLSVEVSKKCS